MDKRVFCNLCVRIVKLMVMHYRIFVPLKKTCWNMLAWTLFSHWLFAKTPLTVYTIGHISAHSCWNTTAIISKRNAFQNTNIFFHYTITPVFGRIL